MSDKLPMTREQIAEELAKCAPWIRALDIGQRNLVTLATEHVLRIGTTELREENKLLAEKIELLRAECFTCPRMVKI